MRKSTPIPPQSIEPSPLTAPEGVRRSIGSASVYALAAGGQRGLTFALLPLFTRALSPSEYGRVAALASVSAVAAAIFSAGFDFAVIRQYFAYKDDASGQDRFVASVWLFQMVTIPALLAVLCLAMLVLAPRTGVFRSNELAIAVLATGIQVIATTVPLAVLRARQQLRPYALLAGATGLGNALFTVLFVVVLRMGVVGWLLGTLCANAVALVTALLVVDWTPRGPRDPAGVRTALALGTPLIPGGIASLSLQLGDRVLLSGLVAPNLVGVYGLGSNISMPAQVALQSLNQGFMPAYAQLQHSPDGTSSLRGTITLQATISICVGVGVALLGPPLVAFVAPETYAAAASVVPWLTLGYVFYGLSVIPGNGLAFILGRTGSFALITLLSAAVNLALVAVLAGPYGIDGAAAASAIGYLVQLIAMAWRTRSAGIRFNVDWSRIAAVCLCGLLAYGLAEAVSDSAGADALAIRSVFAIVIAALGWLIVRPA